VVNLLQPLVNQSGNVGVRLMPFQTVLLNAGKRVDVIFLSLNSFPQFLFNCFLYKRINALPVKFCLFRKLVMAFFTCPISNISLKIFDLERFGNIHVMRKTCCNVRNKRFF